MNRTSSLSSQMLFETGFSAMTLFPLYIPCLLDNFISLVPAIYIYSIYIYIYIYTYICIYAFSYSQLLSLLEVCKQFSKSGKRFQNAIRKGLFNRHCIVISLFSNSDRLVAIDVMRVNSDHSRIDILNVTITHDKTYLYVTCLMCWYISYIINASTHTAMKRKRCLFPHRSQHCNVSR